MKWIDEKVLQKYFKESFKQYNDWFLTEYNQKVTSVSYNPQFDKYPDVYATLEDGRIIPIEVEWTTKKFDHDPTILEHQDGAIAVLQNNDPLFSIRQLELDEKKFKKWYISNSERIFEESIKEIVVDPAKIKRPPKLWFYYSGTGFIKNKNLAFENGIMGVPEVFRQLERFKDIRKGDLFCFMGPFKGFDRTGRANFEKFRKNKKLYCENLEVVKVTQSYFYDDSKLWEHNVDYLDESKVKNYPHRFKFSKDLVIDLKNVKIGSLSLPTKRIMQKLLNSIFWDGKPEQLIELVSRSK